MALDLERYTDEQRLTIEHYRTYASGDVDRLVSLLLDRDASLKSLRESYDAERARANDARNGLERFKARVVEVTVHYDGGCVAGKTDFLQALGLDYPEDEYRITATWCVTVPAGDDDEVPYDDDIAGTIESYVTTDGNGVSVTVERV